MLIVKGALHSKGARVSRLGVLPSNFGDDRLGLDGGLGVYLEAVADLGTPTPNRFVRQE